MTRVFSTSLAAVAVAAAVFSAGCWSTAEVGKKAASTPAVNGSVNANTVVAAPGQTVMPVRTIDLPAATANRELSGDSIGEIANRRAAGDVRPDAKPNAGANGTREPLKFVAAPENSQIAVAMQPGGLIVETRVFKSHSTIARAELSFGKGERVLKITMRDGRTVSVSGEKVESLRDLRAAQLVIMATGR